MAKRDVYEQKCEALLLPIAEANQVEIYDIEFVKEGSDFCHRIVNFGRQICLARSPKCENCPLAELCDFNKKRSNEGRAKLAEKSQNIYLTHGRGELRSPAGDRRSPLRISKI